ncbi:MAG: FHA domain-containing protein [Planctomycetota bacterium]
MTVTDRPELPPTAAEPTLQSERAPRMMLEICRGRTRFPQRPISGPRFFIGSGAGCDLRLGGLDFPAIHSLIQTRENGVWFETLAATPTARINGELANGEWLRDGDRIEIGAFQFLAHSVPVLPPVAMVDSFGREVGTLPDQALEHVSELSAAELADRLDVEMNQVERFHSGRRAGAHALLQALRRRSVAQPEQPAERAIPAFPSAHRGTMTAAAQYEFQADLDRLCKDLEELASTLERRSETISQREFQFAQAAESLLETQRQLVTQLESALEHAAQLSESREVSVKPAIRVSA